MGDGHRVEVVWGQPPEAWGDRLRAAWAANGGPTGEAATARLPHVVCLLVDEAGAVVGANSVVAQEVPLVGRTFWVHRRFLVPGVPDAAEAALVVGAFEALEAHHGATGGGPVGLCLLVDDLATIRRHPEAVWPRSGLTFAGYLPDGRQVRLRYFDGARIA